MSDLHILFRYIKLNEKMFEFLKTKLQNNIQEVCVTAEHEQRNAALKFFTRREVRLSLNLYIMRIQKTFTKTKIKYCIE